MSNDGYSESEANALLGHWFRSVAKNSIIPRGSRGRVNGTRGTTDGTFEILVNWEVNPAFIMQVPIQATYSKGEAATALKPIE